MIDSFISTDILLQFFIYIYSILFILLKTRNLTIYSSSFNVVVDGQNCVVLWTVCGFVCVWVIFYLLEDVDRIPPTQLQIANLLVRYHKSAGPCAALGFFYTGRRHGLYVGCCSEHSIVSKTFPCGFTERRDFSRFGIWWGNIREWERSSRAASLKS